MASSHRNQAPVSSEPGGRARRTRRAGLWLRTMDPAFSAQPPCLFCGRQPLTTIAAPPRGHRRDSSKGCALQSRLLDGSGVMYFPDWDPGCCTTAGPSIPGQGMNSWEAGPAESKGEDPRCPSSRPAIPSRIEGRNLPDAPARRGPRSGYGAGPRTLEPSLDQLG
jgi:hypothetical protein